MPVEEDADVRTLEVDLAEGRGVHHRHGTASGRSLAQYGVVHRLALAREVPRPLPLADVLEHRPVLDVPGVDRGGPDRVVEAAAIPARQLRERHRHVWRAVRRDAEGAGLLAEECRGDRTGQHAAGLALVAARPDRRVPLDVLDRRQPCAQRTTDVGHGRVPFQVDERRVLVAGAVPRGRGAVR